MSPKDEDKAVTIGAEAKITEKKENGKKKEEEEVTMSEEDQELKDRLETCVSTVVNKEAEADVTVPLRLTALEVLVTELRSATSSMTSVPKPLKFLRPHFAVLKELHVDLTGDSAVDSDSDYILLRAKLGDVLSVLAMTMGDDGKLKVDRAHLLMHDLI